MPKIRKRSDRADKAKSARELSEDLVALRAEVAMLREKCSSMNLMLLRLCCPKEWFDEEVDDAKLWAKGVWKPSLSEVIAGLK